MIVLDTNVISELVRPAVDPRVTRWFDDQRFVDLQLTAVTVAELGYGVARLPVGRRRDELDRQIQRMVDRFFAGRVLPFDQAAAQRYGGVVTVRDRVGRPIEVPDAQIAAICELHGASLATRNNRDFEGLGLTLIDPWEEQP